METPCWVNSVNIDSSTNLGPGPSTSGSRKWTGAFILRPFLFLSRKKRKQSVPRPGTRERRTTFLSTKNWFPFAGCKKGTTPLPSPPFPSIAANKIIHRSSRVHSYFPAPLSALEEGVATIGRADGRGEDQASSNQTGNARVPYDCAACTSLPPLSIARRDHLDRSSVFQPSVSRSTGNASINHSCSSSSSSSLSQCFQVRSRAFPNAFLSLSSPPSCWIFRIFGSRVREREGEFLDVNGRKDRPRSCFSSHRITFAILSWSSTGGIRKRNPRVRKMRAPWRATDKWHRVHRGPVSIVPSIEHHRAPYDARSTKGLRIT